MSIYKGTQLISSIGSGGGGGFVDWQSDVRSANFTATAGQGYFVDSSMVGIAITLPASPSVGDIVAVLDYAGTAGTNQIAVMSTAENIDGTTDSYAIANNRGSAVLVYSGATQGWIEAAAAGGDDTGLVLGDYTASTGGPVRAGFSINAAGTVTLGTHNGLTTTLVSQSPTGANTGTEDRSVTVTYSFVVPMGYPNTGATIQATIGLIQPFAVSYMADFLVVAGGGAGGTASGNFFSPGGGGGAGGLRTSFGTTSGGGAAAESAIQIEAGDVVSVTVGQGRTAVASAGRGEDSFISGYTSPSGTIRSQGGGSGGSEGTGDQANQPNGGSGAGAAGQGSNTNTPIGSGQTGQGFSGGNHGGIAGGGGGGASAVGANAPATTGATPGGAGGAGLAVNILNTTNATTAGVGEVSGSDVYYAGGGGGGAWFTGSQTAGGIGGGGDATEDGADGTGGGGGGSSTHTSSSPFSTVGGDGGNGVVILRMPTASYTGTTTGSPQVFVEGSDTILVYTADGSYTG